MSKPRYRLKPPPKMAQKILRMGHPHLRRRAEDVPPEDITSPAATTLIEQLIATMRAYEGVGIAAPQIGVNKNLFLIEVDQDNPRYSNLKGSPLMVIFNPKIEVLDTATGGMWEGCLSVPGLRGYVERPRQIKVSYLDSDGQGQEHELSDFEAIVFQHEYDHLIGTLYVDRIKDPRLLSYQEEFEQFYLPAMEEEQPAEES